MEGERHKECVCCENVQKKSAAKRKKIKKENLAKCTYTHTHTHTTKPEIFNEIFYKFLFVIFKKISNICNINEICKSGVKSKSAPSTDITCTQIHTYTNTYIHIINVITAPHRHTHTHLRICTPIAMLCS